MRACLVSILFGMFAVVLSACSLQPTPVPDLSYTATFEAGEAGQWTQTLTRQADIAVESGQLHIVVKQPDTLAWSVAGLALADFVLEVDTLQLDGPDDNSYGLIARRVDDENFYSFQVSGDGYYRIQKRVKGTWVNLTGDWQSAAAIHAGRAANHLRVACQGRTLTLAINGVQLAEVTDGDFSRGDIGVIAGTLVEAGAHIAFDNVSVKRSK